MKNFSYPIKSHSMLFYYFIKKPPHLIVLVSFQLINSRWLPKQNASSTVIVSWTLILFSGGSRLPPHPLYFWSKLRPEQPKKLFWGDQAPPPPTLISRSGFSTAFVLGTKHLIGGGNKTYRCNRTAVKTPRLRFLGKLFLKLIPARRLYLVGLWGTLSGTCFHFPQNMYAGTLDSQFQRFYVSWMFSWSTTLTVQLKLQLYFL